MPQKLEVPSFAELQKQMVIAARRAAVNPGITGYKPMEIQEKFHRSKAFIKLYIGGNRAGKTVGGATDTVMKATGRHPWNQKFKPPLRTRAIGVDLNDGLKKIIMPEIAKWMPPSELKNGSWEDSFVASERTLYLENGSFIEMMSYEQLREKFAGTSRHWIWFDEEPPEDIFNENLLRLVDVEGECAMTMTPLFEMSWTYDRLYVPGKAGGQLELPDGKSFGFIDIFEASSLDNEYINPAMIAIATSGMSDEEVKARTFGTYMNFTGAIYTPYIRENTIIPSLYGTEAFEEMKRRRFEFFGCLDQGLRNPACYLLCAANHEGAVTILDEYYASGNLIKHNALEILKMHEKWGVQDRIAYITADPSIAQRNAVTGTSMQTEYAENGVYAGLGNNDVQTGIQRTAMMMQAGKLFITRDCEKLLWELPRYRWAKYDTSKAKDKNNLKEEPVKKDDHAMDAMRYGVMSRPEALEEVEHRWGNIIHSAEVARDFDARLVEAHTTRYFDDVLGTDW